MMSHSNDWYVAVDDVTAGPVPTALVIRGIEHHKVPPEAMVCLVGARRWDPLASIPAFHAAVVHSYPPPPPDSEEARRWMAQGFRFPAPSPLPSFSHLLGDDDEETAEPPAAVEIEPETEEAPETEKAPAAIAAADDDDGWDDPPAAAPVEEDVAVEWDDVTAQSTVDWHDPFESFFLVGDAVELPEEAALLDSLRQASRDTFRDESALWNLALCLAYGSDRVGAAAAQAFFDAVEEQGAVERLDWMSRTLLGRGFVASGIPEDAGRRGVRRLRDSCPPSLSGRLAS
jgi:hypothetical protein